MWSPSHVTQLSVGSFRLRVMVLQRNKEDSKKFTHDMNSRERRRDVVGE